jgi:hypothetical protein
LYDSDTKSCMICMIRVYRCSTCQSIRGTLRSAQQRDIRALTLLYTSQTETTVKERAGFGHRNRLKVSKVARVDKKRKRGLHLNYCSRCIVVKAVHSIRPQGKQEAAIGRDVPENSGLSGGRSGKVTQVTQAP